MKCNRTYHDDALQVKSKFSAEVRSTVQRALDLHIWYFHIVNKFYKWLASVYMYKLRYFSWFPLFGISFYIHVCNIEVSEHVCRINFGKGDLSYSYFLSDGFCVPVWEILIRNVSKYFLICEMKIKIALLLTEKLLLG